MAAVAVALASACFFAWDSCERAVSNRLVIAASSVLRAAIFRRMSSSSLRAAARSLFTAAEAESGGEAAVAVVTGFVGALWALASACFLPLESRNRAVSSRVVSVASSEL
ncbi:MAG TPA: hypothetical protein VHK03_04770 [Aestuariivirgaceae bacterium]|nr:hypothetical protein [Aestuariivirgaceae bacterium]